ncbi:hypothetical protein ACXYX3_17540 [Mycobacterium sp. C3-094]
MTAPDPFGTPGWDALRSRRDHFPPTMATAEVIAELARRKAVEHQAREEAAIRAALTKRAKTALIDTVDHGDFGDASGHLGGDGFDAMATAAVDALEQFYNDGRKAMGGL